MSRVLPVLIIAVRVDPQQEQLREEAFELTL